MDNLFIEKLNNLLSRVSLVDILRDRYKVIHRGGSQYTVQCPFHKDGQETNPSMSVDDSKGIYKCFTCGAKGNVITYLKEKENKSFKEAVQYLGNRFSVDVSGFFSAKTTQKDKIYLEIRRINRIACNFFGKTLFLKDKNGDYFYKDAEKYLKSRKIPFSIIKEFRIGYAPPSWNALMNALTENKITVNNMNILGLVSVSKNNPNHYYDTFVNRIMFPIINEREEIVGFGGRSNTRKQNGPRKGNDLRYDLEISFEESFLGTERTSSWALEKLYTIIENRNENKLPIIVTTRFNKESLLDRFCQSEDEELSEAVIQKLYQFCYGIELKKYDQNEKEKVSISDQTKY